MDGVAEASKSGAQDCWEDTPVEKSREPLAEAEEVGASAPMDLRESRRVRP